ncbi:hypothetical protein B7Z00_03735 [Candidatus Saccharibacteria bacterium 32-50-10]|nr:MAG: hypothetical protein B7Z00_03735 [Candidatus Saccharibacteria bacterium 32-50-10]
MPSVLNPKHLYELLDAQFPPQRWLVEGLIPLGGITLLSGAPESYKTWVMLDTAISVAEGKPLFDKLPTTRTKVLIIDEESGGRILQERFLALRVHSTSPIYSESMQGVIFTEDYVDSLVDWCITKGIGLVVIDSLTRIHRGDENSAKDISALFAQIRKLSNAGISVIILHHNRKSIPGFGYSANDIRGSSDILASVDSAIALNTTRTGYINVAPVKNRIAIKGRPFTVRLTEDGDYRLFEYVAEGKSKDDQFTDRKDAILELIEADPGIIQSQIYQYFKQEGIDIGGERAIKNTLDELIKSGQVEAIRGDKNALRFSINSSFVVS